MALEIRCHLLVQQSRFTSWSLPSSHEDHYSSNTEYCFAYSDCQRKQNLTLCRCQALLFANTPSLAGEKVLLSFCHRADMRRFLIEALTRRKHGSSRYHLR